MEERVEDGSSSSSTRRQAAVSLLKRAASSRSPSPLTTGSTGPTTTTTTSTSTSSDDTTSSGDPLSSSLPPSSSSSSNSNSNSGLYRSASLQAPSLERSASLLARQIAMSKLTGEALPTPPVEYLVNSDYSAQTGLRRGNTVTGIVSTPTAGGEEERKEARTNLIRKLSERRLGGTGKNGVGTPTTSSSTTTSQLQQPPTTESSSPSEDSWEFVEQLSHPPFEPSSTNSSSSFIAVHASTSSPPSPPLSIPLPLPLPLPPPSTNARPSPFPSPPETTTPLPPPNSFIRRSSIPSHLLPLGMSKTDEEGIRRRGSSASSSVALGFVNGRERMDSMIPSLSGSPSPGLERSLGSSDSNVTSSSEEGIGLGFSDEGGEKIRVGSGESDLSISVVREREEEERKKREEEMAWKLKERRLVAKVERKREEGLQRSREGAFPPPEEGYTFPPTSPRSAEESSPSLLGGGGGGPLEHTTGLFSHPSNTSPHPNSRRRSPQDIFPASYLPLSPQSSSSSAFQPQLQEEPLSPTSVTPRRSSLVLAGDERGPRRDHHVAFSAHHGPSTGGGGQGRTSPLIQLPVAEDRIFSFPSNSNSNRNRSPLLDQHSSSPTLPPPISLPTSSTSSSDEQQTPTPSSLSIFHASSSTILQSPPAPSSPTLASSPNSLSSRHSPLVSHSHSHSKTHSLTLSTPLTNSSHPRFITTETPPTPTFGGVGELQVPGSTATVMVRQFSNGGRGEEEEGEEEGEGGGESSEMERDGSGSSVDSIVLAPRLARMRIEELPRSRIIKRLDERLASTSTSTTTVTNALDSPPRSLILHSPVLQVVNVSTCKDRHLFLFSDLLLIAKPIIEDDAITGLPVPSTMENLFIVKSIVELKNLTIVAEDEEEDIKKREEREKEKKKRNTPMIHAFVDRFANDPKKAIKMLIDRSALANDGATIANLIFRHTDLNRNAVGGYLCMPENRHILRAYIERFRFGGVRIDDALRMFLMSVRFPHTLEAAEHVLGVFSLQWTEVNGGLGFDPTLTMGLVMAIMRLSDALHSNGYEEEELERTGGGGLFSFPNVAISQSDFVGAFREMDQREVVSEELLGRVYQSVRRERIEEASDNSMFSMTPDIEAVVSPTTLPHQLTYRTPSELITITLPSPDPKFFIKLHGIDLSFDPPFLSFAESASQSFRVTGTALGFKAMVLIKLGANAPRYQGLPINKVFSIDRAFLSNVFQISFPAEERGGGVKKAGGSAVATVKNSAAPSVPSTPIPGGGQPNRIPPPSNSQPLSTSTSTSTPNKPPREVTYMFSTLDSPTRKSWVSAVRSQIELCKSLPPPATKALRAGEIVAVQVLRDALIPPEEIQTFAPANGGGGGGVKPPGTRGGSVTPRTGRLGTPTRGGTGGAGGPGVGPGTLVRSSSVSKTYLSGIGKVEQDLVEREGRKQSTAPGNMGGGGSGATRRPSATDQAAAAKERANGKSGEEIKVVTEQNSLLPVVLGFLAVGAEVAPHPMSLQGSAFQLPPLDPNEEPTHQQEATNSEHAIHYFHNHHRHHSNHSHHSHRSISSAMSIH